MNCNGIHCPGCGHGPRSGLSIGAVVVLVVLAVIVAKARAIEHGAAEVGRVLVLAAITALSVAVAAGAVAVAVRVRRRTVRPAATRAQLPVVIRELGPRTLAAIEAPRARPGLADTVADPATEYVLRELAGLRADLSAYRAEPHQAGGDR